MTLKYDHVYPHDATLFTQGITLYNRTAYFESGGLYGQSRIQLVNIEDGRVLNQYSIDKKYFGEGITYVNDSIYMLTWREHKGFVFNEQLDLQREFFFTSKTSEGWGITYDNTHLVVSDGSDSLLFWNINTMKEERRVNVHYKNGTSIYKLNELSFINGYIFANIWYSNYILQINPENGLVTNIYDMTELVRDIHASGNQNADVLNGIAYDQLNHVLYITGKNWNKLYVFDHFIPN